MPSISCRSAPSVRSAPPTRRSPRRSPRSASSAPASWRASSRCCSCAGCRFRSLITDLDQARVDKGVAYIHEEIDKLEAKGRLDGDAANKLRALVHGTTDKSEYADCDFVIEAVFEEVGVKQQVFAEIEQIIAEDAILATNTSSLSVEEIGAKLAHPERLVGFHFFNPVAVMPLIEIVKTPTTGEAPLSRRRSSWRRGSARTRCSRPTRPASS